MDKNWLVLIKGAGDLATGVAVRLHRAGFAVAMTELERPRTVRRTVAFAQAIFDGQQTVEGIMAQRCTVAEAAACLAQRVIPVMIDATAMACAVLRPSVLVDGIMEKRNTGTQIHDARLVLALGPGFVAGVDCHAVVETNRGHNLGRVIWQGGAEADTGEPGILPGATAQAGRVLRAPCAGFVQPCAAIGDLINSGATIALIEREGHEPAVIQAPFTGVLRGLIHASVPVTPGLKIGDLDPRAQREHCFTVSDKSLAIAGGVLEALLTYFDQLERTQ
jgi:xanthine dehydrogenase accessory factor